MKKHTENEDIIKRIWKIRDNIQELEDIKDEIIKYINSNEKIDNATRNLWISDTKELYLNIVSAWEMLRATTKENLKYLDNAKGFLYGARSRLLQIISELNVFKSDYVSKLVMEAESIFKSCWDAFWSEFNKIIPEKDIIKPSERIVKISDSQFQLPCSICNKVAVEFKIGNDQFNNQESLLFRGITHGTSLNINLAEHLFKILKANNLSEIHQLMKKHHSYEGLDAYCPECDKIYCWEHYNAREEFDDGFYDCTYGKCPKGHKRMIDD